MPRQVRPHRIRSGALKGRWLVTSWHDYPGAILGYTERPLLHWLQENVKPRETWIDVGAHYGYTALALSELVGPLGHVFAFEPVLTTAGHLNMTRSLNDLAQLTVVPLALSACQELRPLDVPIVRGMAEHAGAVGACTTDRVLAVAFDEIWPGLAGGNTRVHGVKVDVQGMEIEVLTGMQQTLLASRPQLMVEIHPGVDRKRLLHVLTTMGYALRAEAIELPAKNDRQEYLDNQSYCFLPE